mmetsp:Transcript_32489/g.107072  ORF Transcript_32489/g.107072 Transcript_32489/m.107072 type:complete len:225 (+) Transcript_32489:243-917(+)
MALSAREPSAGISACTRGWARKSRAAAEHLSAYPAFTNASATSLAKASCRKASAVPRPALRESWSNNTMRAKASSSSDEAAPSFNGRGEFSKASRSARSNGRNAFDATSTFSPPIYQNRPRFFRYAASSRREGSAKNSGPNQNSKTRARSSRTVSPWNTSCPMHAARELIACPLAMANWDLLQAGPSSGVERLNPGLRRPNPPHTLRASMPACPAKQGTQDEDL